MYPSALPLDRSVTRYRLQRRKELLRSAKKSVCLRGVVILLEVAGALFWRSTVLCFDAIASSLDLILSIVLIACIRLADRPPDKDHPLGHGRFEPIAGLIVGFGCIFVGLLGFFFEGKSLFSHQDFPEIKTGAFLIPLFVFCFMEVSYRMTLRAAKKKESPALLADAAHYRADALTSCLSLIALFLAAIFPTRGGLFDHIGAVAIALFMMTAGIFAARKNIVQLLDKVPPPNLFEKIRKAALAVDGILATEKLRIQLYGPDAFVAIDIEVDPQLTVAASHRLTQKVRRAIQYALPSARDVIVHVEPYFPGDHENR